MKASPIRRRFIGTLSLFLTALVMAFVVWIAAINATDPMEKRIYPHPVPLEVIGLDKNLLISNSYPQNIELVLTAPQSTWATLINGYQTAKAIVNLAGLSIGQYDLEIKIQIDSPAVRVENISPRSIHVILEPKTD